MRWTYPRHGERRARKRFLWLPKQCERSVRWLEVACWSEDWDGPTRTWIPQYWLYLPTANVAENH